MAEPAQTVVIDHSNDSLVLRFEESDVSVGKARFHRERWRAALVIYVHEFGVVEGERRKGFGLRLMKELNTMIITEGAKGEIDVRAENEAAIALYLKAGWVITNQARVDENKQKGEKHIYVHLEFNDRAQ